MEIPSPWLIFAFIVLAFLVQRLNKSILKQRSKRFRDKATDMGWQWLDTELPSEFPAHLLDTTSKWQKPRNCVYGEWEGDGVLFFDYKVGRSPSIATCIARRRSKASDSVPFPRRQFLYQVEDHWILARTEGTQLGRVELKTIQRIWHEME